MRFMIVSLVGSWTVVSDGELYDGALRSDLPDVRDDVIQLTRLELPLLDPQVAREVAWR